MKHDDVIHMNLVANIVTFYLFQKLAKHHSILALVGSIMLNKIQISNLNNGVSKNKHNPCEFGLN
jgi:hypothetical protein